MLIRFVVNNFFSFGEMKEFNMIPGPRLKTKKEHKYSCNNINVLKLSSIYGANGAGKSNLVKSFKILKKIIIDEKLPSNINKTKFKFRNSEQKSIQLLSIEFLEQGEAFYYAIEISDGYISTEELYVSGLGINKDKLIFERKTNDNEETKVRFLNEFENDEKSQVLKSVLLEEFVKPNTSILKLLSKRDNKYLKNVKKAYDWFDKTLQIITPVSKPIALAHRIDVDKEFKKYAEDIMCSFNIGVSSLNSIKKEIKEFFGEDNENELDKIVSEFEKKPDKMLSFRSRKGDEIVIVKENDTIYVKQLKIEHFGKNKILAEFDLNEESDGTIRLLDFIPAFQDIVTKNKVYIIDEIERSIHPLLIKELIKKFSNDDKSLGQLIFTTHESNLLDQKIFRQDEIWFAEKDLNGITDLYSLSDYKEHNTIDIRKGYLNGRYGSIPFLANLRDLEWQNYDFNK